MAEIIKTVIDVDINTSGAAAELRSLQQQINAFNLTLNKGQLEQGQASKVFAEGLRNSINAGGFFRAEVVKMQTAAGALDATLRKGQGTLGQFFSASFNKQGGIAAEVFALAAERARTMQTQFIATAKASKGMQEALAVRPLTAFSAEAAISAQRMQILNSMFKQGTTGLINFGKNVQWTGRQLMVGFTIPLTIFGTTAGKVFSDLEKQAVAFKKVYGDIFTTPAELEENFKAVQGLSREFTKYGIAAKDTLGLAAQAAAAGRKNTELTDAVRESTRLATLGQMDQNAALETTISLQSAFRLSGQELADTINFLNMVENQTVVSLQDIAAAIPRVAPVIKGLGGDVKDLTVFLAAMQEGGVSAEQGANALKSGLGSLINPTKAATDVLAGFKINLDSIIQTNRGDLMGTVTAFSQALSTLDEFSRQQALESLFGKFQYARLGALFENISREGSQAQQVISTLGYSTEQLAKSAEKELTTVEQAFSTQLTGAIERLKIAIAPLGEIFVKMAIPIVNMVTKMVESFNRLPEGVKNIAALATALGGVLLPAATMIFGLFANLIGTFAKFSHSIGMFGVTLVRKGPLAAIKSLTQSANYLSLSEIDAANAARQLGSATELANAALLSQVGSANSADIAIKNLTNSYRVLISEQTRASQVQPFLFGTGQAASNRVGGSAAASVAATMATRGKSRIKAVGLNQGGSVFTPKNSNTVPGVGNTDTVPAMLTPGEFVVNKESTQKNLGLLHAINDSQKLNIGGKVKNGIQYAMAGFQIGNTPGYSAATNAVAAKLARTGQAAVGRTRGAAPKTPSEAKQLKNNFVYLLDPINNQQLTGVRTMAGFDKRGVPLDVLKQDMVSENGLWMIDALAKGNWKKDAYRSTLENNFSNIANKYSGKEIRFLDSAGLERVQPLLGKPEYENVQFVSVKDLQNKDLLDNLTPDHIDRLMIDATQVSKELKTSKSRGTTTLKDVYRGIPGMESYTKILTNWRGERKPEGKHGAHMYNMGGKVKNGIQYAMAGQIIKGAKKFKIGKAKHVRKIITTKDKEILQDMVNTMTWGKRVQGARLNDGLSLYGQGYSLEEIDNILIEIGYFKKGLTDLALISEKIKKFAKPEKIKKFKKSEKISQIRKKLRQDAPTEESRKTVSEHFLKKGWIDEELANLINGPYMAGGVRSHYAEDAIANAKKGSVSFPGYLGQAIIEPSKYNSVYNQIGVSGSPKTKADHDKLMSYAQELLGVDKRLIKADFDVRSMMNKGGQVPGMQYANVGKIIAAMSKTKGRNESIDNLSSLSNEIKTKILSGQIKKRSDFTSRSDRALFDNSTNMALSNPSKDDLLDLLTTDHSNLLSNSHLYSIALNKNADDDVLNLLATQFKNRLRYAKPKELGDYLNQTAKIIQDRGIKLNKGGMIPGVQYAVKGKEIEQLGKIFGINANIPTIMAGALPTLKTQFQNKPKPFKKISEYIKDKSFINNDVYFIYPRGGEPHEARIFMGRDGQLRKQRIGYEPDAVSKLDPNFRHGSDPRRYKEEIIDPNFEAAIYNKNEYSNAGAVTFRNKGGIIPGVQYLNVGNVAKRMLDTPSRRSREILRGLFKDSDKIAKSKGKKGIFDSVTASNKNFLDTPLAIADHAVGQAYALRATPVYESLLKSGVIKPDQFKTVNEFMEFLGKKSLTNRSNSQQNFDPIISEFNKEYMRINHGLGPDDTIRFYRNARPTTAFNREGGGRGYYSLDREMGWGYGLASDIAQGGGKRYFIDLKPGEIPGPILSGGYADEFAVNIGDDLAKKAKEVGDMLPNISKQLTGQQGQTRFFNDKKFYKKDGTFKFNKGNIVPGVGSTDTVPAMLTPGEFVINKESTKQNYDLLTAINSGKAIGLNKGGMMPGVQYLQEGAPVRKGPGIAGTAAGFAASMLPFAFTDQLGTMGSMAASMVAFSAAQKATTTLVRSYGDEVIKGVGRTKALGMAFQTLGKVALAGMGSWVALATSIISLGVIFTKINNNIKDGGARLSNAMYGSSESLNKMAKAFGRMTPNQQAIQRQADLAAGQATSEEAKQQSSKFMESESGKQLLKDLSLVKKMGEDQVFALKNQLASAVITGVITSEEARQIATDVGIALKDKNLAVNVSGQLSTLLGPDGEKIENNRIQILAGISPTIDPTKIKEETQKQLEVIRNATYDFTAVGYDFGLALERANIAVSDFFGQNVENARAANTLQENILENVKKEAEVRALINNEYQSGQITFSEREGQLSQLNKNNIGSQNVDRFFKDAGVSGLKTNISGGTNYDKFAGRPGMRFIGSLLPNNTKISESTTGATGSKEDINTAVDFINKTHEDFSMALSSSGISENRQEIIKDYIDKSLKGDAELIAKYELDILSGNKSLAAIDMAAGLETSKDAKDVALVNSIMTEGKYGDGDSRNLLAATESASKFADSGMQDKILQMASKGQNAEIDTLVTNYEKVQALPPEIVKSLKVNLETNVGDINRLGPITEGLTANFKLLDQLPAGIDKESFFKFNAVDANGNPIPLNDLAKKVGDFNNAYNNLDSGNKKLRKEAEIAIYKTVNDDPKAAEEALAQAKKDIKDFEKLPASVRSEVIMSYASTGQAQKALDIFLENAKKIGYIDQGVYQKLLADANAEKGKLATTIATAIAGGSAPVDGGTVSALQSAKDAARQTKEVIAGQAKLLAAGISMEALDGLSPEAIIELSKKSGKALRDNIKLFNEQAESIRINQLVLEQLALEENPVKKALEDSKKAVEGYDDQIKELNKTIEESNRADELDRRRIEDKNKALENLTKKEKNVNDQYDERIKALDKVASANDRVAEKQRQQIDLASALTSGDIAGAAQAAAAMTQTGAQYQIEDTKTALEAQRQSELDGLTESINGRLMTRKDIQAEIDSIEETIYQRNINLRTTNDAIHTVQTSINTEKEKQYDLNNMLKKQEEVQVENAKKKYKFEEGSTTQAKARAKIEYASFLRLKGMKESDVQKRVSEINFAFGGMIKKYAYGGNVGYRGSKEAPPALKMAMGNIVPGLGNTDRVPALLTPGEFVVRKSVAQANMPLLKALNSDVFPSMSLNTPDVAPTVTSSTSTILNNTPVYNYSISVNVPNTTASPDEIANVVVSRIKRSMDTNIRSNRY